MRALTVEHFIGRLIPSGMFISTLTELYFLQGYIDPKYLVVWKRIGIQSPLFWIGKHLDGEVWGVTKWRSAGYPSANYIKLKVRRLRLSGLLLPRIHIYKHSILAHTHGRQSDLRPLRVGPDLRVCLKAVEETSMTGLCSHQVMPYNLDISSH